jgi:hypothetical protein
MKRFLLFAGTDVAKANGVTSFVADFDSSAEALVLLVDHQKPAEWWHILDTQTGEVIERRQIRLHNGTIGFQRSDRIVGTQAETMPISVPQSEADLDTPKTDLPNVVAGHPGIGNGHARGSATAEHPPFKPHGGGRNSGASASPDAV